MAFVSVTRVRVRFWRFVPLFLFYALRSARQASRAEGSLKVRLLRERNRAFWTATAWESEAAMKKFMLSGVHRASMTHLAAWCDEASFAHWNQEGDELPIWTDAAKRMRAEGRLSRVSNPSADHSANAFADPPPGSKGEVRFK